MEDSIVIETETLEQKVERLEKSNKNFQDRLQQYEKGEQNLYRSLQRKMNEISAFLNTNDLAKIQIDDKSKSFERVFLVLEKCEKLATSVKTFGEICGAVTVKKEDKKPFVDTIAEERQ
jgi:hypothetical protein